MVKIDVKPLSVNGAWQGKKFKTKEYKDYEVELLYRLPHIELPEPPYAVQYTFGVSSKCADWDNPIKPLQDILQKRYGFNDKHIVEAVVKKEIVPKGKEFVAFEINHI